MSFPGSASTSTTHTPEPAGLPPTVIRKRNEINLPVFLIAAALITGIAIAAIYAPTQVSNFFNNAVTWTGRHFGSFYIALATAVLVLVIALAWSRFGRVRLGPDDSRPQFSTFSWASMLFAAGISTDIMFFAVAEPITQYMHPPVGEGQSIEAARQAAVLTIFHYGLHGWGLYTILGLALAYFTYRRGFPLSLRATLRPLLGKHVNGWLGHIVDAAALVGGMFGIATSLGVGIVQLNVGLEMVFGIPRGLGLQIGLLVLGVTTACWSAISGVDKGVKFLSMANVVLAGVLAVFVLVTGRFTFLVDAVIGNVGDFFSALPGLSLETYAWDRPDEWLNGWTLFFWAWWITWAAFVGLFLARISRGRTLREFVIGTLTIPFTYVVMWVGIFGNSALDLARNGSEATPYGTLGAYGAEFARQVVASPEEGLFSLLSSRPLGAVAVILAVIVGLLFYVTSADSGALVMSELSMRHPVIEPHVRVRRKTGAYVESTVSESTDTCTAGLLSESEAAAAPYPALSPAHTESIEEQVKMPLHTCVEANGSTAETHASADDPSDTVDGPPWMRVFWAVATGALTVAMLLAGGIPILQSATVVMALPFAVVVVAVAVCLVKEIRAHEPRREDLQLRAQSERG
ncbi:BCCT family transporter [Schaalia sp. lx-100]|uniref:BCCT family transporter n=1 Tax=Schaalia sp. lx-100 TaxID=2899081 RepID=UPI001E61A18E|nr:BCCT family transporter [Schaalia sp. lx-100]MCD4557470.1 BCCT family transporter [Schaalia sp. lx-100]